MMDIRPTQEGDYFKLTGKRLKNSLKGITAVDNGDVVGVAAVMYATPLQAFSVIDDRLRKSPKTLVKAAKQFRTIINTFDSQIIAIASEKEKTSDKFLQFIGFTFHSESALGRLYVWQIL